VHPYLFDSAVGSDVGVDPAAKARMYENQFIIPWINKVGAAKIHCGETFMFTSPCYETGYVQPNIDRQSRFLTSMINIFFNYGIGFQLLTVLQYAPNYQPSGCICAPYNVHKAAVDASNYASATPSPTPAPTPTPTPMPTATPSPTPAPTPSESPTPTPTATPTPSPTPTPTATPTQTATTTPTSTPTTSATASPSLTVAQAPETLQIEFLASDAVYATGARGTVIVIGIVIIVLGMKKK
jgi:hypothetical protein